MKICSSLKSFQDDYNSEECIELIKALKVLEESFLCVNNVKLDYIDIPYIKIEKPGELDNIISIKECSADKYFGVYTIHIVDNKTSKLIYIGMSGKDTNQGQDLFSRISNTRNNNKAEKVYSEWIDKNSKNSFLIFNFVLFPDLCADYIYIPCLLESLMLSFYYNKYKKLPEHNKKVC